MTWWVINCPGTAQGPAPRSLFLLHDKKERRNRGAVCINNRRKTSSLLRKVLLSILFRLPEGTYHSPNSHFFPEPSELIFANP